MAAAFAHSSWPYDKILATYVSLSDELEAFCSIACLALLRTGMEVH